MHGLFKKFFFKTLDESNRKPNKIWVDKGSEFYNRSMKSRLQDNDIRMHSIHNKGKSALAERFLKTLKNKIDEFITSISKNKHIVKLDDIDNKYSNAYHRTIKMKPVDVKLSTYIDLNKENNKEGPKFKVGDNVRIPKNKNIFAKTNAPNRSEEVFVIKKLKTLPWTYINIV